MTMLADNAIRTAALGSAWLCGTRPREVSFVGCCQVVLASWDVIGAWTGMAHRAHCVSRLEQIGKFLVGQRLRRIEPRVRKKRGSNNRSLMMQPRHVFRGRLAARV